MGQTARSQRHLSAAGVWLGALGCFALAGLTGALFRFGLVSGLPFGLQFAHLRHAHSHLMYFGWATPTLIALIGAHLMQQQSRATPYFPRLSIALVWLGLLAYPPFLLFGYESAPLGQAHVPLASIAAALTIVAWYIFAGRYRQATGAGPRPLPVRLWDAALIFMLLASLGAWGRVLLIALHVTDPFWSAALVHLFLDLFSDGWFILALLGVAYAVLPDDPPPAARLATRLVVAGLPVTFLLGVPVTLVPSLLRTVAGAGGALVGIGLLWHVGLLWPRLGRGWRLALAFLALKASSQIAMGIPGVAAWAEGAGLRIPYLHWLLLGFVTLGLIEAAAQTWGQAAAPARRWFAGAILALQGSLLPLTGLWPPALAGKWAPVLAAWATLLPPSVAIVMLWQLWRRHAVLPPVSEEQR